MKTNNLSEAIIIAFIDSYYTPYIINYVISKELEEHKSGKMSLFSSLSNFENNSTRENSEKLIKTMCNFVEAAIAQVLKKHRQLNN